MASRIEVELTSHDTARGEWTWRAVGARQPRGTVPATLVWEGASVGDVARAEIARRLDGIEILSLSRTEAAPQRPDRIDVIGSGRDEPPVTIQTVRRERRPSARTTHDRDGRPRPERRTERRGRSHGERGQTTEPTPQRSRRRDTRTTQPEAPAAPRLRPRDAHRRAFLDSVIPEHRPIAEALLRGGMPEVRTAIARDREAASREGRAPAPEEATLKIAEDLLPRVRTATWLDRADAALAIANTLALRDLRSVVASVDPSSKDPSVLDKATTLRDVLTRRVADEIARWHAELREAVEAGRTVRALRLASRLPDPTARVPEDAEAALIDAVNRELVPDTPAERWMVLIDAVANSPIRRAVTATGLPEAAPAELVELAKEHAGRIPSLGRLLGVSMPAPPKPEILARVPRTSRRGHQPSQRRDDTTARHAKAQAGSPTAATTAPPSRTPARQDDHESVATEPSSSAGELDTTSPHGSDLVAADHPPTAPEGSYGTEVASHELVDVVPMNEHSATTTHGTDDSNELPTSSDDAAPHDEASALGAAPPNHE